MSFRTRLALASAAAVAVAVVAASFVVYFVVKEQLYGTVDTNLRQSADLSRTCRPVSIAASPARGSTPSAATDRRSSAPNGAPRCPSARRSSRHRRGARASRTAARGRCSSTRTRLDDHLRVMAFQYQPVPGYAVEVARSLGATDDALARIKLLPLPHRRRRHRRRRRPRPRGLGSGAAPVRRLTQTPRK